MRGQDVFVVADNVFTPLGKTTAENFENLKQGRSAVKEHSDKSISLQTFYGALFGKEDIIDKIYTKFEKLLILSISSVLHDSGVHPGDRKTVLILSSTKGNISLLEKETNSAELQKRIALTTSA